MTKTELVAAISEKSGVAKADVEKVLKGFEDEVSSVVSAGKEKLTLPGFLSFERTRRAARTGRNPQTGETIQIAARRVPTFKAGKELRDRVNRPAS
jgi:DNA-binding protein HU-beta